MSGIPEAEAHKFCCMFDGCERSFYTLREFKLHITEDHTEDENDGIQSNNSLSDLTVTTNTENEEQQAQQESDSEETDQDTAEDETTDDVEEEEEEGEVEDDDDEDYDVNEERRRNTRNVTQTKKTPKKKLDDEEKSALNGLLKLCEIQKSTEIEKKDSESIQESKQSQQIHLETINNIPVIPLLSPTNRSPKSRKYPTATPIVMAENESSAKFYVKKKETEVTSSQISNVTTQSLETTKKVNNNRILGKKRKLSEMDSDELAHLCLKLQDKISAMDQTLQTTHKQLITVRNLYRKKSKMRKIH